VAAVLSFFEQSDVFHSGERALKRAASSSVIFYKASIFGECNGSIY
jgi:hypothetical protein